MKTCPKCKRTWPDSGKFCPMDGESLVEMVIDEPVTVIEAVPPESAPRKPPRSAAKVAVEPVSRPAVEAKPAPEPKPAPESRPAVEPKKGKAPRAFSETKWFMVGEAIKEQDLDPELVANKELQKQYKATQELPAEVRKKFSLSYGTDEKGSDKKK